MTGPLFVIDEVETRPGRGEAFLASYLERYAPLAQASGLVLVHRWVDPPLWLDHRGNRLLLVWRVDGPRELWATKRAVRNDPAMTAWWETAADDIEHRRRAVVADADLLDALADV